MKAIRKLALYASRMGNAQTVPYPATGASFISFW